MSDKQYDNETSVAGVPLAQHPEDKFLATTRDIGEKKLYGILTDLQRTASFVLETGVPI